MSYGWGLVREIHRLVSDNGREGEKIVSHGTVGHFGDGRPFGEMKVAFAVAFSDKPRGLSSVVERWLPQGYLAHSTRLGT